VTQALFHAVVRLADQRGDGDFAFALGLGDGEKVGVRAGVHLDAGWAGAAGIEGGCGHRRGKPGGSLT